MSAMKKIRQQVASGQPLKMNNVIDEGNKKCQQVKGVCTDETDSEEDDRIWKYIDDSLKGVKNTIESLKDPEFDWSHVTIDGKESHKNFKNWLDSVCGKLYDVHKKNNDDEIFE